MLLNCEVGEDSFLGWESPEYSLKGLMLKLNLQYFHHLMWRNDSFVKTLMLERLRAGGTWDDRVYCKLREFVMDREAWHAAVHVVAKYKTWLSNWTWLNWTQMKNSVEGLNSMVSQMNEPVTLKMGQMKFSSLKNWKKKKKPEQEWKEIWGISWEY